MEPKQMNVLVTGATGFLGGAVAKRLHNEGHTVVATGRNEQKGKALAALGIHFQAADLSDAARLEELCCGQDWIIHSGALSSTWGAREAFWQSNVLGTHNMVQAALRQKIQRFLHISSPSIYFQFAHRENIKEDDPLPAKFINSYTASKYAAEQEILMGVQQGLPALILRPRAIYGEEDTAIFPRILRALERGRLPIIGSGTNKADLSYIDNVVEACMCALVADVPLKGRAYNITDGQPIDLWKLLSHIAEQLGLPVPKRKRHQVLLRSIARGMEVFHRLLTPDQEPILTEYAVGLLSCTCTLNIDRAKDELGYRPVVSTEEGIRRLLVWWRSQS